MRILEAMQQLNALTEETFSTNSDGLRELRSFRDDDDLEGTISIIDPEAKTEDDLQDSYVGKVIIDCSVCHSKLYKDKEEITLSEDGELANEGEECPYCYSPDGYKVIGEITQYKDSNEDDEDTDDNTDIPTEDEDKDLEESIDEPQKIATNQKGDYLVKANSGKGYTAFNKNDVCIGGVDTEDENEAKNKFMAGKLNEGVFGFGKKKKDKRKTAIDSDFVIVKRDKSGAYHYLGQPFSDKYEAEDIKRKEQKRTGESNIEVVTYGRGKKLVGKAMRDETLSEGIFDKLKNRKEREVFDFAGFKCITNGSKYKVVTPGGWESVWLDTIEEAQNLLADEAKETTGYDYWEDANGESAKPIEEGIFGIKTKREKEKEAKAKAEREAKKKADKEDAERIERERQADVARGWKERADRQRQARSEYNRSRYNDIKGDKPSNTGYKGVNYSGGDYYESLDSKSSEEDMNEFLDANLNLDAHNFGGSSNKVSVLSPGIGESYKDVDGIMGEKDATYSDDDLKKYWDAENENDPVLAYYKGDFKKWVEDTKKSMKKIDESIENLSLDTEDTHMEMTSEDNGKVTIVTEPLNASSIDGEETLAPISDETQATIEGNNEEEIPTEEENTEVDVDIDEVDEESFDEMGESLLRNLYENVESYKTTAIKSKGNQLKIEGTINFKSGKSKPTAFLFESNTADRNGRVSFYGRNKDLAKNKKQFFLEGKVNKEQKSLVLESMRYNIICNAERYSGKVGR